MSQPQFDPSRAVSFDLGTGRVAVDNRGYRVLVPADLLLELFRSAGTEAGVDFGRRLGTECGRRVADRLAADLTRASVEVLLDHLGGELALMGLGNLGVERWGRALVMTFEDSPLGGDGDGLLSAVLEGAIQRAFGRDSAVVKLGRDGALVRFLVAGRSTATKVAQAVGNGRAWAQLLVELQSGTAQRGRA